MATHVAARRYCWRVDRSGYVGISYQYRIAVTTSGLTQLMWRTGVSSVLLLTVSVALLYWQTDGLQAFTQESARRLSIAEQPIELSDAVIEFETGERISWRNWQDRYLIVDFIFTRCTTTCLALGHAFRRVQEEARDLIDSNKLVLLSVSIDPDHDSPDQPPGLPATLYPGC